MFIHTLAPQAAPRVKPEFPLSLWIRVRREMLARMVRQRLSGPGCYQAAAPLHHKSEPNLRSFSLEVGNLEPQDEQGCFRVHPARPARTVSLSSRQATF